MLDIVQRVLGWLLTLEVVGILAAGLSYLGIPPIFAPILVIIALLLVIRIYTGDRFMLQRWRWKIRRWRRR